IVQKGDRELWDIERQIQERKEIAQRGTQDDAICQICQVVDINHRSFLSFVLQKTKFADGIGHKCIYCQLRSCARCGGRTPSKNKSIWACSLCQKRQQILARTGKWFQQAEKQLTASTPSPCGGSSAPISRQHSQKSPVPYDGGHPPRRQSVATTAGVGQPRRQTTLHRQSSMEQDHHHHQPSSTGGGHMMNGERASTTVPTTVSSPSSPSALNSHRQYHRQVPTALYPEQPNQPNGQRTSAGEHNNRSSERQQKQRQRPKTGEGLEKEQQQQKMSTDGRQQSQVQQQMDDRHLHYQQNAVHEEQQQFRKQQQLLQQQQRPSTAGAVRSSMASTASRGCLSGRQRPGEEEHSPRASATGFPPQCAVVSTPAVLQPSSTGPSSSFNRQAVVVVSSGEVSSPMRRRTKASRPQQPPNCSSSDDELSSPKPKPLQQLQQNQSSPLPNVPALQQNNSQDIGGREKDFRKRSGGSAPFFRHFQHHSLDFPMLSAAGARGAVVVPLGNNKTSTTNNALASRIRNYLSNPAVSWQPSTDQRHLIGHLVLHRLSSLSSPCSSSAPINNALDFGMKVVGGRNPASGRLAAFVSRVRPGSVADSVGQLRTGDEVLEWNGHSLQNVTPETVYNIVQSTKGDSRLELIVSRSLTGGDDDFLNLRRLHDQYGPSLPHSQSMNAAASPFGQQQRYFQRAPSPLVLHQGGSLSGFFVDPMATVRPPLLSGASAVSVDPREMCGGRMELALLYLRQKRELIISLSRAYDLLPRVNGAPRNAYVKLFLLPDRSERSRRQSKVLSDTLAPVWNEHFFYEGLDERAVATRVLEVTLWDFDPYESHSFLGETLIELANAPLNNLPLVYSLTDMDEDNSIRLRLRQRRYSSMTPPMAQRSRSQMSYPRGGHAINEGQSHDNDYWQREGGGIASWNSHSAHNLAESHSRNKRFAIANDSFWETSQEDWTRNGEEGSFSAGWESTKRTMRGGKRIPNGYLSDQEQEWEMERRRVGAAHRRERREHRYHRDKGGQRRPQSATALRNIAEWELRHKSSSDRGRQYQHQQSMDYSDGDRSGGAMARQQLRRATRQQELREQEAATGGGGYGSDGSVETLMSVNSAQSMQNKTILRQQQLQRLREQQHEIVGGGQSSTEENNDRGGFGGNGEIEEMDDQMLMTMEERQAGGTAQQKMTMKELKDRKKSLMTRLIPGRNGPNDGNKRLGFARSEEVGIPEALAPPEQNKDFIKQESTDSSDNWLPIRPDRPLGSFVENLGPGQVVGRQALGSAQMGELQAALSLEPSGMVVDVMQARGLTALKQSTKTVPGIYVKAY
uniref:C2 domain-containing protein n=1 Tax=Globodera pallida TaxID=36090 RepID=A0A183CN27_GLOPA